MIVAFLLFINYTMFVVIEKYPSDTRRRVIQDIQSSSSPLPPSSASKSIVAIYKIRHTLRGRASVTLCDIVTRGGGRDPKFCDITFHK